MGKQTLEQLIETNLGGLWIELREHNLSDMGDWYRDIVKGIMEQYAIQYVQDNAEEMGKWIWEDLPVGYNFSREEVREAIENWQKMKMDEWEKS